MNSQPAYRCVRVDKEWTAISATQQGASLLTVLALQQKNAQRRMGRFPLTRLENKVSCFLLSEHGIYNTHVL
jgi:hypothetical protein